MDNFKLETKNSEPSVEDKKVVVEGMIAYHVSKGHIRKEKDEHFSIIIKDQKNKTLGAIVASFRWGAMHIETLWIDKTMRNKGWGTKLMNLVEQEASKRNCHLMYTDTYSWQAPRFYEKLGYVLYGKLDDFPKGCSLSYYAKKLEK
ncbi:GNAT family N-acetyltransferase [Candidatus Roizmanbacteria bacterium CG_4_10_14_0_8_um_filter_33_9]|uniref:GNAT family N-acetyltransferase n=1 Tax=Candidatus Roizmanbacteria bacterium CG_4_10_14_0_8_um_filter_33_9 TaxID=1974826 RepID=A0A2M7QIN5_9BACT|nr:MAG: GNAT family N-acetyltransferase [Candidatus Roizmanbacteria bacterium CG_4_10_14_0_8_um_filter_33_9]